MDKSQRKVILWRDVTCIVIGAVGLLEQLFLADVASPILVPACLTLLLGPAGVALWAQRSNDGPSTIEPSSGQPPEPVQPYSPPPPSSER